MSLFDAAMDEMKASVLDELESRVWERLLPRIERELHARYMAIPDAAHYLHVSIATVRRLVAKGTLPCFKVGAQIFLRQSDIDAWVEQQVSEGR